MDEPKEIVTYYGSRAEYIRGFFHGILFISAVMILCLGFTVLIVEGIIT